MEYMESDLDLLTSFFMNTIRDVFYKMYLNSITVYNIKMWGTCNLFLIKVSKIKHILQSLLAHIMFKNEVENLPTNSAKWKSDS